MPNLLGRETEREKRAKLDATESAISARNSCPNVAAHVLFCGDTAWLMPPGNLPIRLSREGTAKLLERLADLGSENVQRKAPSMSGEEGRFFRSALGASCKGAGAPLTYKLCPDCEAARLIAPLFGEGATLKSAGLV